MRHSAIRLGPGEQIKQARKLLKLTQHELSANTGIPVSYISKFEHGDKIPPKYARALTKAFKAFV